MSSQTPVTSQKAERTFLGHASKHIFTWLSPAASQSLPPTVVYYAGNDAPVTRRRRRRHATDRQLMRVKKERERGRKVASHRQKSQSVARNTFFPECLECRRNRERKWRRCAGSRICCYSKLLAVSFALWGLRNKKNIRTIKQLKLVRKKKQQMYLLEVVLNN